MLPGKTGHHMGEPYGLDDVEVGQGTASVAASDLGPWRTYQDLADSPKVAEDEILHRVVHYSG